MAPAAWPGDRAPTPWITHRQGYHGWQFEALLDAGTARVWGDHMEPIASGIEPSSRPWHRPQPPAPDIDVTPFADDLDLPLSRGAPERKLQLTDHYRRRAQVIRFETLTSTGTVCISFRVIDDEPFDPIPGHFVGVQAEVDGLGVIKSPYCLASSPDGERTFRLLVRVVEEGPLSRYLGDVRVGDVIAFRGPSGRSMLPPTNDTELVLLATGVGVAPYLSLLHHILAAGFDRRIELYWGLRLVEDICLVDELDQLVRDHDNFSYRISLSQPPDGWAGLRGRLTESVPPSLATLGGKRYYLVGNGAMIEEMSAAVSDMGVDNKLVHQEAYFNVKYRPDQQSLSEIRDRFVASDLFSPFRHQQAGQFLPERPVTHRQRDP